MSHRDWLVFPPELLLPSFDAACIRHSMSILPLPDRRLIIKWTHRIVELSMSFDLVMVFTQDEYAALRQALPLEVRESDLAQLIRTNPNHSMIQEHRDDLRRDIVIQGNLYQARVEGRYVMVWEPRSPVVYLSQLPSFLAVEVNKDVPVAVLNIYTPILEEFRLDGVHYYQRYTFCTKRGCFCQRDYPIGHGPYWYKWAGAEQYLGKVLASDLLAARFAQQQAIALRPLLDRIASGSQLTDEDRLFAERLGIPLPARG